MMLKNIQNTPKEKTGNPKRALFGQPRNWQPMRRQLGLSLDYHLVEEVVFQ